MSTNNTNMLQYINTKSLVFGCLDFAIQQEQWHRKERKKIKKILVTELYNEEFMANE